MLVLLFIRLEGRVPAYDEKTWNEGRKEFTRNCYDYALNRVPLKESGTDTDQNRDPGQASGKTKPADAAYSCDNLIDAAEADGVDMGKKKPRTITLETDCGAKCYKVALFVGPVSTGRPQGDYHWVRQDDDKGWSHKFGKQEIRRTDDTEPVGQEIRDPEKSVFIRPTGERYTFCRYGCVCPDDLLSGFPSSNTPPFAIVQLKEPATLVSGSIDLLLREGRLSLVYADRAPAANEVSVEIVLYSGARDPRLILADADVARLIARLSTREPATPPDGPVRGGFLISSPLGASLPRFVRVVDGRIALVGESSTWFRDRNDLAGTLTTMFLRRAPNELRLDVQGAVEAALMKRRPRRGRSR